MRRMARREQLRFARSEKVDDATMTDPDPRAKLGDIAAAAGIERIHVLAWRDLADVEAGGSEIHAATVARLWAEAGLEVVMRTSYAQGSPPEATRDGYRVIRRAGRYMVFPRAVLAEVAGRHGPRDALVEIWNGVPFLSPLWARGPRAVFLHHHHDKMWPLVLSPRLARLGSTVETKLAPPLYRRTPIITLSESSRTEIARAMGLRADRISVVPPGIDPRFMPGEPEAARPLIVAVGRLMPSKRFDTLIRLCDDLRARHDVELVIVGEGYERDALTGLIADLGAESWVTLAGRVSDRELVGLYQRAWLVAATSVSEGWGMTLTEAAACGTPVVATDIAGHRDSVAADRSGVLASDDRAFGTALDRLLGDTASRAALGASAAEWAGRFTWAATARGTLEVLAADAARRRR